MKITLDEFFRNSFVLSIADHALDRFYAIFKNAFPSQAGNMPRPVRGFKNKGLRPSYNCKLGHSMMVRMAKALDLPFVALFEDDAYPCIDAESKLKEVLENVPDCANVLVLGWICRSHGFVHDAARGSNDLVRFYPRGILYGTQSWIVFKKYYDDFIRICETYPDLAIDDFVRQFKEVCVVNRSPLFIQYNEHSSMHHMPGYTHNRNSNIATDMHPPAGFAPYNGVYLMRTPGNCEELKNLIKATGLDHIRMIEVGSYAGESANSFVSLDSVDEIWCIDPWKPGYDPKDRCSNSDFSAVEAKFDGVMDKYPGKIRKFKGTLHEFLKEHKDLNPDLVYIDACNKYQSVKYDILAAMSMQPAFISGHDYGNASAPGVAKAVNEVLGSPTERFRDSSWLKKMR